ncbi:MAG: hypothetical protein LBD24_08460 [Spirochaetaceae bacterium]|nr:hypothetical protein [Spirochaetaceae bacterium]
MEKVKRAGEVRETGKIKKMLVVAALFLLPFGLFAKGQQGGREPVVSGEGLDSVESGQLVEITGRVRLVGSMPHPRLVITDESERDWYVVDEEKEKRALEGLDQQFVTVRARVELVEVILANNQVLGIRRIIREIAVIPDKK